MLRLNVRLLATSLIAAALSLSFADSASSQTATLAPPATLTWKFEEGDQCQVEVEQNLVMQMSVGGNPMNTSTKTTSTITWEVTGVSDEGNADIKTTIDRMSLDMDGPMGKANFDSDDEADEGGQAQGIGASLRPMIGVEMMQKMEASGKITEVEIPDSLKAAMEGRGQSGQMMESIIKGSSLEFPTETLQVGATWDKETKTKSPMGEISILNTYTYRGIDTESSFHVIDVDVKMQFGEGGGPAGAKIDVTNQSTEGKIFFDEQKGRINHSFVDQNVDMNITVGPQAIQQTLKQQMAVRFKDR